MPLTRVNINNVNTTVTSIADPLLVVNKNSTAANVDIGLVFNRDGGATSNVAIIWDETNDQFALVTTSSSGATNANVVVSSYANVTAGNLTVSGITGNLIPSANVTYSLGDETHWWKSLYVSGSTIYIGGTPLTVSGGTLLVGGQEVQGGGGGANYTDANVNTLLASWGSNTLSTTGNISAGGVLTDNYYYANGTPFIGGGGGGGASTLNDLSDVTISSPSNGQVLKYNGSAWVNGTDATGEGGGGATSGFETQFLLMGA